MAGAEPEHLRRWLGINGVRLWNYANGRGAERVAEYSYSPPIKSIGHGITCTSDLGNDREVWKVMFALCRNISHRLRKNGFMAEGVAVTVKNTDLRSREFQCKTKKPIRCSADIAEQGFELFKKNYDWSRQVRAVSVRAINLVRDTEPVQVGMFDNVNRELKRDRIETAMEDIRAMYGKYAVTYAGLMNNPKLPDGKSINPVMPNVMCV